MITLSPIKRRIVYVTIFEFFAIVFSTFVLMALSQGGGQESLILAIIISIAAVTWNFIYNTGFEAWELRKRITKRTFKVRSIHATGFEGGLFLICLPLYMIWYDVGIWKAMLMETALLIFFLFYTFLFTLLFDQVFTRQMAVDD